MASLTIRKLDESVKAYLRLRSARNGRSVEEEVRVILREMIPGGPAQPGAPQSVRQPTEAASRASTRPAPDPSRVTLIIGGGIAAYKGLDLIRGVKEGQMSIRSVLTKTSQESVSPMS